jgi:hypothetical protein
VILKKSSGTFHPEKVVPADELISISRLEAKILADRERFREINGKFIPGTWTYNLFSRAVLVRIFI